MVRIPHQPDFSRGDPDCMPVMRAYQGLVPGGVDLNAITEYLSYCGDCPIWQEFGSCAVRTTLLVVQNNAERAQAGLVDRSPTVGLRGAYTEDELGEAVERIERPQIWHRD